MSNGPFLLTRPDVFGFAGHLLQATGRGLLIEVGDGANPASWVRRTTGAREHLRLTPDAFAAGAASARLGQDAVLIWSADAPPHDLAALKTVTDRGTLALLTWRSDETGAPENAGSALADAGLPVVFQGRTCTDNFLQNRSSVLLVLDTALQTARCAPSLLRQRPLAIVSTYNDADIVVQLSRRHLADGLDLHVLDNWSDDGGYEQLESLAREYPDRVTCERFPADGPSPEYRWASILDRKAAIAAGHEGRWVLHVDSDELRLSPWDAGGIAEAIAAADAYGSNLINFAVLNFGPTRDGFGSGDDPPSYFSHFDFPDSPPHFNQHRAWRQPSGVPVELSSSGGHRAKFPGAQLFPYNFPLLHYSLRSTDQARRKIYRDRRPRFIAEETEGRGWHNHYDRIGRDDLFLRMPELMERFAPGTFRSIYCAELLSDTRRRRLAGSLVIGAEERPPA